MGRILACLMISLLMSACEQLGIPDPERRAAATEAEGRAIGSACRHAGRALEDCFALNPEAQKASVFEGWRTMNDYMTENNIVAVKPMIPPKLPADATADVQEADAPPETHAEDGSADTPLARLRNRSRAGESH